jgi:hypothetical protein
MQQKLHPDINKKTIVSKVKEAVHEVSLNIQITKPTEKNTKNTIAQHSIQDQDHSEMEETETLTIAQMAQNHRKNLALSSKTQTQNSYN